MQVIACNYHTQWTLEKALATQLFKFHEKLSAKKLEPFHNHTSKHCSVYVPTLLSMCPSKSRKFSLGYINIIQFIKLNDKKKYPNAKKVKVFAETGIRHTFKLLKKYLKIMFPKKFLQNLLELNFREK